MPKFLTISNKHPVYETLADALKSVDPRGDRMKEQYILHPSGNDETLIVEVAAVTMVHPRVDAHPASTDHAFLNTPDFREAERQRLRDRQGQDAAADPGYRNYRTGDTMGIAASQRIDRG